MGKQACTMFIVLLLCSTLFAEWGKPPKGWDGFQFGLVEANTEPWKSQLVKALDKGIQIDYRYRYCTSVDAPKGWIFTPWYNYAKGPNNIRPSITIYMLAGNVDEVGKIVENGKDMNFMKSYFEAIKVCADSCKGYKPIFVIEPDVWGYFLQGDNSGLGDKYLNQTCNINNLGYPCLSGFSNTFKDLPGAIIAMCKEYAPDCYVGILTAHWNFNSFWLPSPVENAERTLPFLEKLLRAPYKGDFIAIEKYGADAGSTNALWYWDDQKNADFVTWCKTIAQGLDLPLLGWQTSIGYTDAEGYPKLPNEPYKFEDTFFEYFFKHKEDYINAGFIGYLAGCANAGQGTVYGTEMGEYDNGWFLDNLTTFVDEGPYDLNLKDTPIKYNNHTQVIKTLIRGRDIRLSLSSTSAQVALYSANGRLLDQQKVLANAVYTVPTHIRNGCFLLQIQDGQNRISQRVVLHQ